MSVASNCKIIYVDLDDVLCQTARHFLVIVEREFGKVVSYDQLTNFDISTACELSPKEGEQLYRIVHEPDELMRMAPIDEAVAALREWASSGYEIAIVTGRPPPACDASLAWLAHHRVTYHSFTMVDKYSRFDPANTVAISLNQLAARQYCWAVEDSLPMAEFLAARMAVPVALVDCPWNRSAQDYAKVSRHTDWKMIVKGMPKVSGGNIISCT